jgi:hypothetical protein
MTQDARREESSKRAGNLKMKNARQDSGFTSYIQSSSSLRVVY